MANFRDKFLKARKNDGGFSLAEVVIAMVILVVAGSILLNGLVSNQRLNSKVNNQSLRFGSLLTAADIVTAAPFTGCKKVASGQPATSSFPYVDLALPTNVTVEKVEWLSPMRVWNSCAVVPDKAPNIQRVILKYQSGSVVIRRTVLKTFGADPVAYTAGYGVRIINPVTNSPVAALKREMGPTSPSRADAMTASLGLSATTGASNTCYYLLPTQSVAVEATVTSPDGTACGTSTTVNITTLSSTTPIGTYTFDIAGFNPDTGGIAYPATLVIRVRPSLQLDYLIQYAGSGSSWIDSNTATGCTSFNTKACRVILTPFPNTGSINYSTDKDFGLRVELIAPSASVLTYSPTISTSAAYTPDASGNITFQISKKTGTGNPCTGGTAPTSFTWKIDVADFGIPSNTVLSLSIPVTC